MLAARTNEQPYARPPAAVDREANADEGHKREWKCKEDNISRQPEVQANDEKH